MSDKAGELSISKGSNENVYLVVEKMNGYTDEYVLDWDHVQYLFNQSGGLLNGRD